MASVEQHYVTHLAPLYEWMVGDIEAALLRSAAELNAVGLTGAANAAAVDLGAGIGLHAIPLAQRGYSVFAIDSSEHLLMRLRSRAAALPITCINADLLDFAKRVPQPVDAVLCMGDTLTHLRSLAEVEQLLADAARVLKVAGVFVASFRDYLTAPLHAEHRFIPVRSDAQRILTCCLEYNADTVTVHDLLHEWIDGRWLQRVSSYRKLRLSPDWLVAQLRRTGFAVRRDMQTNSMVTLVATRAN